MRMPIGWRLQTAAWTRVALALPWLAGAACSRGADPGPAGDPAPVHPNADTLGPLALRASTRVLDGEPDSLHVSVTVTNLDSVPREFETGGCGPVLGYAAADPSRRPVWSSARRRSWPGGGPYACGLGVLLVQLAPGESRQVGPVYPVPEVLGDSLPAGRYRFVAQVWLDGRTTLLDAGVASLGRE